MSESRPVESEAPRLVAADPATSRPSRGDRAWNAWLAVSLFVLAIVAYLPALFGEFTWDDDQWLVDNTVVHAWNGLHIIWNPFRQSLQFYPVTLTMLWLEHKCWGLVPEGYHAVNMLLHGGEALLLWLCLRRLGLRGAWLGALLWAIHPVQVESVAWISEIKNTLSGLFYFLAAWAYLRFEGLGEVEPYQRDAQSWLFYALTLLAFIAGMLSKAAICTLPAALVLVLWWKRRLDWKRIASLLPLFVIGLGISAFGAWQEHRVITVGGAENLDFTILERTIICGKDVWFYLRTLAVPYPLMAIYPRWNIDATRAINFIAPCALALALAGLALLAWRGKRGVVAGLLFFLATLSPALGFVNFYTMHYTFVADHYDYLACAGILVLVAEGLARLSFRRTWFKGLVALLVVALIGATAFYSSLFQTNMKLWTWNVRHNPLAFTALHNLGVAYMNTGHVAEGIPYVQAALAIEPDDDNIQRTMGRIARDTGHFDEAIAHLRRAIALRPRFGLTYKLLGDVYDREHDLPRALAAYAQAIAVDDSNPIYFIAYAEELKKAKQLDKAADMYVHAIDLSPGNLITRYNYGNLLLDLNRPNDAIEQYQFILKYQDDTRNGPIWHNLAYAYAQVNQREKALEAEARGTAIDQANARRIPAPATTAP